MEESIKSANFAPMEPIRNKVQESGLITLDLEDFKPEIHVIGIDIADQLWQGIALKEKDFRQWIKENDWTTYSDAAVYVHCSVDAIIPTWAYMLVSSQLIKVATKIIIGSKDDLMKTLITDKIQELGLEKYKDGRIIIKGCSDITSPAYSMVELMKVLQPVAKSIMYGEPCSAVPVFKKR